MGKLQILWWANFINLKGDVWHFSAPILMACVPLLINRNIHRWMAHSWNLCLRHMPAEPCCSWRVPFLCKPDAIEAVQTRWLGNEGNELGCCIKGIIQYVAAHDILQLVPSCPARLHLEMIFRLIVLQEMYELPTYVWRKTQLHTENAFDVAVEFQ